MLEEFYHAAAAEVGAGAASPLSPAHLRRVTEIHEELTTRVKDAVGQVTTSTGQRSGEDSGPANAPVALVTGASGFLGSAVTRELARRGFRVRGIGRSPRPDDSGIHEWIRADLGEGVPAEALAGADVVVHAAAATASGFEAHERDTIGVTRNVLAAMAAAGVRRLVYVSSISVLRPPAMPWEVQDEQTPLAGHSERLGPYTWGKCRAEILVANASAEGKVDVRILRPAALVDWEHIEFPGLLGRRLYGRWHMGLGRPGLPLAVLDVHRCAAVIGWCAQRFTEAPGVVNLLDADIVTRKQLLDRFRAHGWRGRMVWVPISLLAVAFMSVRTLLALRRLRLPEPMAVWSILRARRFDATLSRRTLEAAERDESPVRSKEVLVR